MCVGRLWRAIAGAAQGTAARWYRCRRKCRWRGRLVAGILGFHMTVAGMLGFHMTVAGMLGIDVFVTMMCIANIL